MLEKIKKVFDPIGITNPERVISVLFSSTVLIERGRKRSKRRQLRRRRKWEWGEGNRREVVPVNEPNKQRQSETLLLRSYLAHYHFPINFQSFADTISRKYFF